MMVKIASWNIEGRLTNLAINRRGTPDHILKGIVKLQADVLFLAEAFGAETPNYDIGKRLAKLGYHIVEVPYDNADEPRLKPAVYSPSMMLLSKLPIISYQTIRLGDLRNAILAYVKDPTSGKILRILGIHLDDRSESLRLSQVPDLIQLIKNTNDPTIVMGDFNAMHGGDILPAKLLQSLPIRTAAKYILPELALRAVDMAKGDTLKQIINQTGLRDADRRHRPTSTPKLRGREWLPSVRLMQIDHILASPAINISNFHISTDGGSDHRAISAMVTIDKIS